MSGYHRASAAMSAPPRLFHGTPGANAESILSRGLHPGAAPNFEGLSRPDSVYLTDSPDMAAEWVYNAYVDGSAGYEPDAGATVTVFEVDPAALDPALLAADTGGNPGDWRYAGPIPPSALSVADEQDYTDDVERECERCGRHPWNCSCDAEEGA